MIEADLGLTQMAFEGANKRFIGDENLLVKFFMHPKINQTRTKEEGRPVYEELEYIQIMQPGNKDSVVVRPVRDMDRDRFPEHYQRFKLRQDQDAIEGTLLEEWPGINRAMAEELRFFNIRTVEQLASVSDSNAQGIMGIQLLKDKANAYLEAAKDEATGEALMEANARIDTLMEVIEELKARLPEEEDE